MVEFNLPEKQLMDRDLDMVRSGVVTEFRGLSRVTQDSIFWGIGTVVDEWRAGGRTGETMTGAVRAEFHARDDTPAAVLFALYPTSYALSDFVKSMGPRAGDEVAVLRALRTTGVFPGE